MSQNADTVRQDIDARDAFMRGELSSDAYAERLDPQLEVLWPDRQTFPDFPQHLRGLAEFVAASEQYRDGWIDHGYEVLELIEVPDGRVVALLRQSVRGRQSGVPLVFHYFALYTVRDGKTRKIEYFRYRADALQAAGLGEQATPSNLDLVRSIYEDRERGDFSRVDWAHPEIEYLIADSPTPTTFRGLAELAAGMRESLDAWEDLRARVDEYRELDEERVLVLLHLSGRGKTSGLDLEALSTRGADLVEIHDGKVTKIVKYLVLDRALADLGLEG